MEVTHGGSGKVTAVVIVVLVVAAAATLYTFSNLLNPTNDDGTDTPIVGVDDPIRIINDSDFAEQAEVKGWPGNGTQSDPYVIENLSIVSSIYCIEIRSVEAVFVIRNCALRTTDTNGRAVYLFEAHEATVIGCRAEGGLSGIELFQCERCSVQDCNVKYTCFGINASISPETRISGNTVGNCTFGITLCGSNLTDICNNTVHLNEWGVMAQSSYGCHLDGNSVTENGNGIELQIRCVNWTVTRNDVLHNSGIGLKVYSDASGTVVYDNNMGWNEGSNAWDDGAYDSWDDGLSRGNSWSDYSGIGSYAIPGSANSADHYPSVLEQLGTRGFFASQTKCGPIDCARGFVSTDVDGPSLRYYLRRYYYTYWGYGFNLSLELFVEDPSGVGQVLMMSSYDGDAWQNATMIQDAANAGWYASYLLFPADSSSSPVTGYLGYVYEVKYAANDTLGNWARTQSCTYQMLFSSLQSDGVSIELYDTPDLWYLAGTTGHTVTWAVRSGHPNQYALREDSHLIEDWPWTGPLTANVDGLSLGNHVFALSVSEGWASDADNVTVHVVEQLPAGYSITTVGPLSGHIQDVLAWEWGLAAASIVAIVIVLVKRRTSIGKEEH